MSTISDMDDDAFTFYARQQIWYQYAGTYCQRKCLYPWCSRMMTQDTFCVIYYDYTHMWNVTSIDNMRPVCDVCYASMRRPTMREWVDYMDHAYSVGPSFSYEDAQSSMGTTDPVNMYVSSQEVPASSTSLQEHDMES